MGRILKALGLMKSTEHTQILVKREDELLSEIGRLENKLKKSNGLYLSALDDLEDAQLEIKSLKEELNTKRESLDTAMLRNKELQKMIDDLKSDKYLRKAIAPDRTKSKNIHVGVQRPIMVHK